MSAMLAVLSAGAGNAQPLREWTDTLLRASRTETPGAATLPAKPQWHADPMNVFVVVETGDDHVSLIDGDRFEVLHRFQSRPVRGEPLFAPDGRYLYLASDDGWIAKYDIWNLMLVTEVRAGLDLAGLAVSSDGLWLLAANASPRTLALFDSDLRLVQTYPLTTLDGRMDSRAAVVYDASPRKSFIVALKDINELWEISYDVQAEPIFDGLVHDYRMKEGIAKPGFFGVRRIPLEAPLEALLFDPTYRNAVGVIDPARGDSRQARVINFDVRRVIAVVATRGVPHLQAGVGFPWKNGAVLAFPMREGNEVAVVDTKTWRIVKTIIAPGSGAYLSSHEESCCFWVGFRDDPSSKGLFSLIDKQTLALVGQVGEPGCTLSSVGFTRNGRYALATLQGADGATIVFDTLTMREVKRLPMRNPAGNYNVWNRLGQAGRAPLRRPGAATK